MATAIQFLRSSISQLRPTPAGLSEGMPFLNFNSSEPGLFFRLSDNTLGKIGPVTVSPNAPNSTPTGLTGNTIGEQWLDTTLSGTQPREVLYTWDGVTWVAVDGGIRIDELPQPRGVALMGPETGGDAVPTFRALVEDDMPTGMDPADLLGGGTTPGALLIGGPAGWGENLLQSEPSIDVVNAANLITVGVRAGDIAGFGADGTNLSGDGHVQLNVGGQFTSDNRFKFDPASGVFNMLGTTNIGSNAATDFHTILGGMSITGDVTLTALNSLNVGGDAIVGHNMTIGSDPTERLDVFNRSEFNADVRIIAPAKLTAEGDVEIDGNMVVGNADLQTLTTNSTSDFLASVSIGSDCFDTFNVTATSTFDCDTTFNGNVAFTGVVTGIGNLTFGDNCTDVLTFGGTVVNNCDIFVGANATSTTNQLLSIDAATGDVETQGQITIQSFLIVNDDVDINALMDVAGAVNFQDTLNVDQAVTFGDTLQVTDSAQFDDTITVAQDAFLQQDLVVAGLTDLNGNLDVLGNSRFIGNVAITGNSVLSGTLTVDSPTTLNDTLTVLGNTTIGDNCTTDTLTITAVTTLNCAVTFNGNVDFNSPVVFQDVTIEGDTIIGDDCVNDTLVVTAVSTFNCATTLNDDVTLGDNITDAITINGTVTATSPVTFGPAADFIANTDVTLGATAAETLTVKASSIFESAVTIDNTLDVTGNTTIGDAAADLLTVNATSTFLGTATFANTISMNGDINIGNACTDTLTVTATADFTCPVTLSNNVTLGDAAADVITINGTVGFTAPVSLTNNFSATGGTLVLGDNCADTLTITATTTINCPTTIASTLAVSGVTTVSADILPSADGAANLGSGALRFANVFTQDMHFNNEGTKGNDVDGTTGNWTLQEGNDHIFFINNKTGVKFRVVMEQA